MSRLLSAALALSLAAPAFAQTVDEKGAAALSDSLARYIGRKAIEEKLVTVAPGGDGYAVTVDFRAMVGLMPKQGPLKVDVAPYTIMVKPRGDGSWDVSSDSPWDGSFEVERSGKAPQTTRFSIKDSRFAGVYDPDMAAFVSGTSSMSAMSMVSRDGTQDAEVATGPATATFGAAKAANGGVDFTMSQKIADFVETLRVDDPESGLKFPLTVRSPEMAIDASGTGVRSKALLDLLAFGVAHGEEARKAVNQNELKQLLLAALPLWEKAQGSYGFRDFAVESPLGTFGASQFGVTAAADGISQNGRIDYTVKASGLKVPDGLVPAWSAPLLPTEVQFSFGGANLDLDTMARKAIAEFDLGRQPPLPEDFGDTVAAGFMAKTPKVVIGHSVVRSSAAEVAFEGEVTFPEGTEKPDIAATVDVAGYDRIVDTLQAAAGTMPDLAQYVPVALAIKGFGKTLPDGRIEWAVNGKPDGSVTVNGVLVKPADPPAGDDEADGSSQDDGEAE